jgi:hypothetical protein
MTSLPTLIAEPCPLWGRENLSGHRNVADAGTLAGNGDHRPCWPSFHGIGSYLAAAVGGAKNYSIASDKGSGSV